MTNGPEDISRCAVCGNPLIGVQKECPVCNPVEKALNVECSEYIVACDNLDLSVLLSATSVSLASGTSVTTTTTLPPEILSQPQPERDAAASELIIKADGNLTTFATELPGLIHDLLETCDGSAALKKGPISVFFNCHINAGSIGAHVTTIEVTSVNTWNMLKDNIDIASLRSDLKDLIKELAERANAKDDYTTLTETGLALNELEKANGPGMLEHLKKAGKWALDIALGTGKEIAAKVIAEVLLKP